MTSFSEVVALVLGRVSDESLWRSFRDGYRSGRLQQVGDTQRSTAGSEEALLNIRRDTLADAGIETLGLQVLLSRLAELDPQMPVVTTSARVGRRLFIIVTSGESLLGGFCFDVERDRASRMGW